MSTRGHDPHGEGELRALYEGHALVLLGYALRLTGGDRARAEDIVQETLVRAWRNLDRLDESRGLVRPWLFTVAQRVAIDAHRARRARLPRPGASRSRRCPPSTRWSRRSTGSSSAMRCSRSPVSTAP